MIRNHLMIFACVLAMSPAFAQASTEEDGVAVFFNLCGGTVAAVETPFDPSAFKFTKLGPDVSRKFAPPRKVRFGMSNHRAPICEVLPIYGPMATAHSN
jgi:hypothetical protein